MPIQPAAIAIVLDKTGKKVLLVKRKDVPMWVLPGGGIDAEENPSYAVIREVFEETGLVVATNRQCAHYTPINSLSSETHLFICHPVSGSLLPSHETDDVAFFALDQLPPLFFFIHKYWLKESLSTNTLISRPLNEVSYLALAKFFLKHPGIVLSFAKTRFFGKTS